MKQRSRSTLPYYRRSLQHPNPHRGKIKIWTILIIVSLFVLTLLGYKGWRIYERVQDLRHNAQALASFRPLQAGNKETLDSLVFLLRDTKSSAQKLRNEVSPFLPITNQVGWLPAYGADIAAAEPLLDTTMHLTDGLEQIVVGVSPLLTAYNQTKTLSVTVVAPHLYAARPRLQHARQSIITANSALDQVDVEELSPKLRSQVEPLVAMLPLLDISLNLAVVGGETTNTLLPAFDAWEQNPTIDSNLIAHLHSTRSSVQQLRQTVAEATVRLQDIPQEKLPNSLRSQVQQAEYILPLADATLDVALAAEEVATIIAPLLDEQAQSVPLSVGLTQHLLSARPQLEQLHQRMTELQATLETTPIEELLPSLQRQVQQLQETLPRGLVLVELATVAPDLLGANGSHDYLILALNPDELRAIGGLVSVVGVATINQGHLEDIWMHDTSLVDGKRMSQGPYIEPPEPLRRYMGLPQWGLGDTGWSPDFRYSASAARYFYNLGHDPDVADVIAFTPQALQYLLEATGPLAVAGTDSPVSADNLLTYMRTQYDEKRQSSESFLEPLLEAMLNKVINDPNRPDSLVLMEKLRQALNERHLQLFVTEAYAADLFTRLGWDGAVRHGLGDFLMVVDSNVGYGKSNANIQQAITYTVDLQNLVSPRADLDIHYTHMSSNPMDCWHYKSSPWTEYESSYIGQMNRCYWDYLRVLLAPGSVPKKSTRYVIPAEWLISNQENVGETTVSRGENGTTMLSTLLVVPAGGERSMSYGYELPDQVLTQNDQGWRYLLRVQKQAGRESIPLVVQVLLPDGAVVVDTSYQPHRQEQQILTFEMPLDTDKTLDVVFR